MKKSISILVIITIITIITTAFIGYSKEYPYQLKNVNKYKKSLGEVLPYNTNGYQLENDEVALVYEFEDEKDTYNVVLLDKDNEIITASSCKADSEVKAILATNDTMNSDKLFGGQEGYTRYETSSDLYKELVAVISDIEPSYFESASHIFVSSTYKPNAECKFNVHVYEHGWLPAWTIVYKNVRDYDAYNCKYLDTFHFESYTSGRGCSD